MMLEVLDRRNAPLEVLLPRQRVTNLEVFQGLFFTLPTSGDVVGPPSAVDSDFVQFDGTTGKLIKDGGLSLDTDGTLAADSDLHVPSQKSVKTYVDTEIGLIPVLSFIDSIVRSGSNVSLAGDVATPGTSQYYGTDGGGVKGYHSFPSVLFPVTSVFGRTGVVVAQNGDYAESMLSFTDILTNNVSTVEHGFMPKLPNDPTLFFNGVGQYITIPGSGTGNTQLISGGGVAWTGTGYNYIISAATYLINGVQYSSAQTPVTLATADPTHDRIDVFYADVNGLAGVITGTPAAVPVAPSVDPASQIYLDFAYVTAASTMPAVTNENIYLEDTEYTMSTNNSGQINLASTNNPYQGTKCIEGTAVAAGTLFTGVKPSGTLSLANYTQLVFQIRSKATWASTKSISIFWMNGTTVVGASQALKQGAFGFNSSQTTAYQQIVIPAPNFGSGQPVDRIRFSVAGGGAAIGFYIDNIILQAGTGGGGGGGGTVTNFSAGNLLPLFTTTVGTPTSTPVLGFVAPTNIAAHNYYGNNGAAPAAAGFHQIDYSELTGTPTPVSVRRNLTFNGSKTSGVVTGKVPGFWTCPFNGTIVGWNITVDTGTITFRVWKIASGTSKPTVVNNINTSGISLSTGTAVRSSVVSDFTTTTVTTGDIFAVEITAVSGVTEFGGAVEILQT